MYTGGSRRGVDGVATPHFNLIKSLFSGTLRVHGTAYSALVLIKFQLGVIELSEPMLAVTDCECKRLLKAHYSLEKVS